MPAHKTVADIKEDLQKDNLDVAGFSNEPEPVPLFARTYKLALFAPDLGRPTSVHYILIRGD